MIDLYAMGSPNVVKIYIALEETGFPYIVPVDVFGEEQFKPQFPKFSPNAEVPVITDHDGPGGKSYRFPPFLGGQSYPIADIATLPMGTRGRRLPRQARRSRLPQADGLGWHHQQPSGDDSRPGRGR